MTESFRRLISLMEDYKIGKPEAKYTDLADHCGICRHFIPDNKCEIVDGDISHEGWCKYFLKKSGA